MSTDDMTQKQQLQNTQQDTLQKAELDVIPSQHCQNCSGKGRYMSHTDIGPYEIQCPDCNGTGKEQ